MKSKITNPKRAGQLIDFAGLEIDGTPNLYPTDIDALIEYKDRGYIYFEIKHGSAAVPTGQRLALQRMVDDAGKIQKEAIAFICEHDVHDTSQNVIAAQCRVRELYYSGEQEWRSPEKELTAKEAMDIFLKRTKLKRRRKPAKGGGQDSKHEGGRNFRASSSRQGHCRKNNERTARKRWAQGSHHALR